jgi:hypothetical protein
MDGNMPDKTDKAPEVPVEAASDVKVPVAAEGKEKSVVTTVFAPAGPVPKSAVIQAAIRSVRDAIPVVYKLDAEITGAKKATQDKQDGTSFEVTVTYTPRDVAGGKNDPVDVDRVLKGLEVPRSVDDIFGHDGDPDFLKGQ